MPPPAKIKKVENVFEELIKSIKAPVEFDLPSALEEWKFDIPIKRNVYLTKKRVEDDGIFCSCTPSSRSSVACDKDCQCGMLFSCCSSNCKCDNKCANKSFQHRSLAASLPFLSAARRRRSPAMPPPAKMKKVENVFEELIKSMKAPVEFDLPSALKEWKLGYYIPITRNVYLTKRRVEDDGIFCSCTPSSGSSVACDKYCQCGMLFSCCSSDCKCDNKCANKSFQHRPLKKTKLITTEKCGFGLVAEDEIKKGEFVIEYVGEVIDDRTCEERLWKMKRQRDTYSYLCEANSNMVIDATNKGNMSRFINHSCDPNTEMQKWTADGETRVGIFALRDIKEGEELTYKFVQFGADQDCHCGSSNCRKMLVTSDTSPESEMLPPL